MNERDREWRATGFTYGASFASGITALVINLARWLDADGQAATAREVASWSPGRFGVMMALYLSMTAFSYWRGLSR